MQALRPATDFLLLNDLPYYFVYFFSFQEIQEVCQKDKYGCQQQKDIKAFSLDEVTKAIASLPMILKIHSVLMYHGISEDNK